MFKREVIETVLVRFILVAAGTFSSILTARVLGPEGRGDYFFVITVAAMISQFGNFGLHSSNTYLVARDSKLLGKLLSNSMWVSILAGGGMAVAAVIVLLYLGMASPGASQNLWFAVLLAPATIFFLLGTNLIVGIRRIGAFNKFQLAGNCLLVLFMILALYLDSGVCGFLMASVAAWALTSVVLFAFLSRLGQGARFFDMETFRSGFRYASKAYLACLLGFLVLRCNVLLLTNMAGSREVGFFSVAAQMADVLIIFPSSIGLVLFPEMVRDSASRWAMMYKALISTGAVLGAVCIAALFLTKPFVAYLFGQDFLPAAPVLYWMLPGVFFLGVTSIVSQYLASIGFPRTLVVIWFIAFMMSSTIGWVMIRSYSGIGASIALSITYALLFFMVLALAFRTEHGRRKAAQEEERAATGVN